MEISEAKVKLVENRSDRLKAFCSVTFDNAFVVRDLKIIEGTDGYFVAMPSRKLTDRCRNCGYKNHLRARFCNDCGEQLGENRGTRGPDGRTKLHADVAHPINAESRARLQDAVVEAYEREVELSKEPGYRPTKLGDDYEYDEQRGSGRSVSTSVPEKAEAEPEVGVEQAQEAAEQSQEEPEQSESSRFGEGLV